jgi:hypothetical protein
LLNEELKLIQDKHKDVRLIYEKVTENIKSICKTDRKSEDTLNNSFLLNNVENFNNSNNYELDTSINRFNSQLANDDELVKNFKEHLDYTRKNIEKNFLKCGKEEFIRMLKDKAIKSQNNTSNLVSTKMAKTKNSIKKTEKSAANKNTTNTQQVSSQYVSGYNEYDYSDEEIKEDDKIVKEEYEMIASTYKKRVNKFFTF